MPCSPSKTLIGSSVSNMSTNDPTLSVEGSSAGSEVKIFPNPTTGLVKVVSNKVIGEDFIYNSLGIVVQAIQSDQEEMTFDLSNLGKGVYYLRMNCGSKTEVSKIILL